MMNRKYFLCLIFLSMVSLFLGGCVSMNHQDVSKPAKRAVYVSCEVKSVQVYKNPAPDEMDIKVVLIIHFKNQLSTPLLIYYDKYYPWFGCEFLASSRENLLARNFLYANRWGLSIAPTWNKIRVKLDKKAPPTDFIKTINPGMEWTTEKTISLYGEIKARFDEDAISWEELKAIDPLWLQLAIEVWPCNLEDSSRDPVFGKRLQERWRNYGYLVLSDAYSEPVPIHLSARNS